ncbi:unnamed protein product [Macrosiphum euphorbiae]|uniref:Uncharacterized protein n=1 Tax=Macrosiphum euphorbiae TaxID=13131 RepID=A0AAV0XUW0_9HEMI|nr:unnamed protein product [Macrosiphum euphorbiae]
MRIALGTVNSYIYGYVLPAEQQYSFNLQNIKTSEINTLCRLLKDKRRTTDTEEERRDRHNRTPLVKTDPSSTGSVQTIGRRHNQPPTTPTDQDSGAGLTRHEVAIRTLGYQPSSKEPTTILKSTNQPGVLQRRVKEPRLSPYTRWKFKRSFSGPPTTHSQSPQARLPRPRFPPGSSDQRHFFERADHSHPGRPDNV